MRPADSLGDPPGRTPGRSTPRSPSAGLPVLPSGERFSKALRAAIATGAIDTDALRSALRAYVEDMRPNDPPERALIAVKERVLVALQRRANVDRGEAGVLLRQIVHWTIEAYFRAD